MRMRRTAGLIAVYWLELMLLVLLAIPHGAAFAAGGEGFATWFWTQIEWSNFGTAAFVSLVGGVVRTAVKLLSMTPTFRVVIEGLADALVSFLVGGAAFLFIMVWQAFRGPVDLWVIAGICFVCGFLRGWVLKWFEETAKRLFGVAADGFVNVAAAALASYQARKALDPQPPKDAP